MNVQKLIENIKAIGGRVTKTRTAVLDCLLTSKQPLAAAVILERLKKKQISVNRTTVYREIAFLVEHNFVREVRLLGQASLFELAQGHHHHLICTRCDCVKTIAMGDHLHEQEQKIGRKEKFEITGHSLEFYGLCDKCRSHRTDQ